MTRKEAIENIKELIDTYITCHGEEDSVAVSIDNVDVEAFDMAIKALEQEPRKDEVILTKEEYGELVSSEFDNGYAKGYREALEQEPTSCCHTDSLEEGNYCPNCGAEMESEE